MIILSIRTDKPEAEIGLFDGHEQLAYDTWTAHRELGRTIHQRLQQLMDQAGKSYADVGGIVTFAGPGSFTGLRIGLTVANALAYSYGVAVTGSQGDVWLEDGISRLLHGTNEQVVMPEYGSEANITSPRT